MLEGGGGVGFDLWHCEQSLPLLGYAKAMSEIVIAKAVRVIASKMTDSFLLIYSSLMFLKVNTGDRSGIFLYYIL